ncbi:hypothetical protein OC846_000519 [Tilletia horrida]|uniref:Homeobox domain-containing protein n=1 Tax=Tilletia horrida TaxID=155126 RepID=A0AAN6JUE5_9BASI|nr:hypothetical protein OC846_000519 [Tilletia horrida]
MTKLVAFPLDEDRDHFVSIITHCEAILDHIKDHVNSLPLLHRPLRVQPIFDVVQCRTAFKHALEKQHLSPGLNSTFLQIYQSAVDRTTQVATKVLLELELAKSRPVTTADIAVCMQSFLERKWERYQRYFLDTVVQAKTRLEAEAAAARFEPGDHGLPEQSQEGTPTKHPRWVVEALELVFAHSDNITRAEKSRLAQALDLQPHQVTIWFQNRRGRGPPKTVERIEAPAPQTSLSIHPEPVNAGGKRKRDFEDEGEREDRHRLPVLQEDSEAPVQYPTLAQKRPRVPLRDFSADSSSSRYSSSPESSLAELDAFPHGRIGKIRHASTDSGYSSTTSVGSAMQLYGGIHHAQIVDQKPDILEEPKETCDAEDGADGHDEKDEDEEDELEDEEDQDDEEELDEEDDEIVDDTADTSFHSNKPDPSQLLFHPDGTLQPDAEDLRIDLNELERTLLNDFKFNDFFKAPSSPTTAMQRMTLSAQLSSNDESALGATLSATSTATPFNWLSPINAPSSEQMTPGIGCSEWFSQPGNCEASSISFSDITPDFSNTVTQVSAASSNTPQFQAPPNPASALHSVSTPSHQPCITPSSLAPASPGPISLSDTIFDFEFGSLSFPADFAYSFTAPDPPATPASASMSPSNNTNQVP